MTDVFKHALPIYLDYMATTPMDSRVVAKMMQYLDASATFGNPASLTHCYGLSALDAVDKARTQIAEVIGASTTEIVFTSGATEANNLAIIGAARFYQNKGKHLITMTTEHKAVLDSFAYLEKEGFRVTYLAPNSDGILDSNTLVEAITMDTILVSIMHVNNETGVVQDIAAIGELLRQKGIVFHVDSAQSLGKLAINLQHLPIDLMSFSAHKTYGPKGIGALYVRKKPRIRIQPQSFGGGHEGGLRSGTLAVHQIVAMAEAFVMADELRVSEQARILVLREQLWQGIKSLKGIQLNGHPHKRVAGNLNVSFANIDPQSLLLALRELAVSTTSACMASSGQPSYVLKSLGLSDSLAYSSIRLSIGRFTTEHDVQRAINIINVQVNRLQGMAP